MKSVKRVFFLTASEVKQLNDPYILTHMPHYELEDGAVVYTKGAYSQDALEEWVEKARSDYAEKGYGSQYDPAD